jgi:hypothetical protein
MFPMLLRRDRERWGMSVGEAGWRLGITRRAYLRIEEGGQPPNADLYEASASSSGGRMLSECAGSNKPHGSRVGLPPPITLSWL